MALGFAVTGVDMSRDLLDELERFKGGRLTGVDWITTPSSVLILFLRTPPTAERAAALGDGSITVVQGDLLELDRLLPLDAHGGTFALAVCMGDTLTHLQVWTRSRRARD